MTPIYSSKTRAAASELTTRWTRLEDELRLLCRSLRNSWCDDMAAVTTFVQLPGDAEYEQAMRALCQRLADEFGLQQTVRREGESWTIRFSRSLPAHAAENRAGSGLVARANEAARRLVGRGREGEHRPIR